MARRCYIIYNKVWKFFFINMVFYGMLYPIGLSLYTLKIIKFMPWTRRRKQFSIFCALLKFILLVTYLFMVEHEITSYYQIKLVKYQRGSPCSYLKIIGVGVFYTFNCKSYTTSGFHESFWGFLNHAEKNCRYENNLYTISFELVTGGSKPGDLHRSDNFLLSSIIKTVSINLTNNESHEILS